MFPFHIIAKTLLTFSGTIVFCIRDVSAQPRANASILVRFDRRLVGLKGPVVRIKLSEMVLRIKPNITESAPSVFMGKPFLRKH